MPYTIHWLVEKQVIYVRTYDVVEAQDILNFSIDSELMRQTSEGLVHLVLDGIDVEKLNFGIGDIRKLSAKLPKSEKRGWTLLVSDSKIIKFFATVLTQISNIRERHYDTVDEALIFLHESNIGLPDLETMRTTYKTLRDGR